MLVIKKHYCISFNRSIMVSLITITFGIVLLLGFVSQNSFAQEYDTNGDGVIDELDTVTGTEVPNATTTGTTATEDTNGDGVIDELDTPSQQPSTGAEPGTTATEDTTGTTTDAESGTTTSTTTTDNTTGTTTGAEPGTILDQKAPPPASAGAGAGATGLEQLLAPDQKAPPPVSTGAGAATQKAPPPVSTGAGAATQKAPPPVSTGAGAATQKAPPPVSTGAGAATQKAPPPVSTGAGAATQKAPPPVSTGAGAGATGLEQLLAPDQKAPPPASAGAGAATQKTICNPSEQLVKKGSSGNAVKVLQTILTGIGFDTKEIDGKFGPNTERAVIQFQTKNSLVKDGIVGKNTWVKLCSLYKEKNAATLQDLIDGGDRTDVNRFGASTGKASASVGLVPIGKNGVCNITKLDLKSGNTGDEIGILQKNLKELGYYPYDVIDKKFGSQTEMSVRLFQISNKLPVTGIVDKATQEKICTASTDKTKHRELILNNFVKNPNVSTLDLLKEGQKFKQFKWHDNDYQGPPNGPNEDEALKLVNQLKNIILEDRVTLPPNAILLNATYQQDKVKYNDYFSKQAQQMKDFPSQRMNKHAIVWFDKMREAAKADGIEIVPFSIWRDPVVDEKRAKQAKNPYAIGGISHALGVAADIQMSDDNKKFKPEAATKPFSKVVDMRGSSIYKWLTVFAKDFNFHPYTHEPWHWEYNYKYFKDVFFSEFKK